MATRGLNVGLKELIGLEPIGKQRQLFVPFDVMAFGSTRGLKLFTQNASESPRVHRLASLGNILLQGIIN